MGIKQGDHYRFTTPALIIFYMEQTWINYLYTILFTF